MKIDTDSKKIDEILNRGTIVEILPDKEEFKKKLLNGERMRFYIGFDATAPVLHLSHAKNFILMEKFRKLGHEVIILFGDFTARIGDPSGQSSARKQLTREEVLENIKKWKEMISPLMDFKNKENPPLIKYNSDWLAKLTFEEIINLASNITVQQILERDMFQKRMSEGKPVHLHEFLYPLMQGYDSVAMDIDVEVCGTDQTFNALIGRNLLKKLKGKEKFVVAITLMENPKTGELMSKSKGNGVFLGGSPEEMFGQIMSQPDEMIKILFINNTYIPSEEINKFEEEMEKGTNPRDIKIILAKEIVKVHYGEQKAKKAEEYFINTFSNKEIPEDVQMVYISKEEKLSETLLKNNLVSSMSDFKRLIDSGSITDMSSNKKIEDYNYLITDTAIFKVGKHRFVKIIVN
ncbi:MAG: tyrosine--tRNA ligase [Patescibacteria group bacterium]